MTVTLGAHNIKAKEETQQIIPVAEAIPHPDYNATAFSSDIMLLKLESKAKRTKAVRPLKLPRPNARVKPGDVCSVAGWGSRSINTTKRSSCLREVQLIIQEDEECKRRFPPYTGTTEICAGDLKKKKTPFKGDSGGPLVCDNLPYGVASYGVNGTISSGVFTKVVHFLPWISRNMNLL